MKEALDLLNGIEADGPVAIGPEMQAQIQFWRSRASGNSRGDSDSTPKRLIEGIAATIPEAFRQAFWMRPDISEITGPVSVSNPSK